MNKSILKILSLGIVFGFVAIPIALSYTKANQSNAAKGVYNVTAVADGVTGNILRIPTEHVARKKDAYAISSDKASATLVHGACTVFAISVTGVSAGDYALIYDGRGDDIGTKADYLVAEIYVGTAADTTPVPFPFGLKFSNDVGIKTTDSDVDVTVAYSN